MKKWLFAAVLAIVAGVLIQLAGNKLFFASSL
jgi:hypothetical protein